MTKFIAFAIIITLKIGFHPLTAIAANCPFTSTTPNCKTTLQPSKPVNIISISGSVSNNKVILDWQIGQNEEAEQFIVERSRDGINFKPVALVFTSEKTDKETYQFYEKAGNGKWFYRVLMIAKNKQTIYSPLVEINAVVNH